ncbi:hypothetical protein Baya_14757 [Bagarius yarrelli]|uniref:Uncharacterized protein n=1 Tax=Bagarius yarrelli TaxID=175774 RepID=A0A556VB78_BAGYA|nr:hypothetical protein Baya_14757 [Bagarius yarrelli]
MNYMHPNFRGPRGATVARLTPDQKVACSNHVGMALQLQHEFPSWSLSRSEMLWEHFLCDHSLKAGHQQRCLSCAKYRVRLAPCTSGFPALLSFTGSEEVLNASGAKAGQNWVLFSVQSFTERWKSLGSCSIYVWSGCLRPQEQEQNWEN